MGYLLDALCATAVAGGIAAAAGWINDLESLGGRTGIREFVAQAYFHRARLGDANALETAGLIAADIDNPHLRSG